jgi:hypothetical protein
MTDRDREFGLRIARRTVSSTTAIVAAALVTLIAGGLAYLLGYRHEQLDDLMLFAMVVVPVGLMIVLISSVVKSLLHRVR